MNIMGGNMNTGRSGKAAGTRISGAFPVSAKEVAASLLIGDDVVGKVLFVSDDMAHFKLEDGSVLRAKVESDVELNVDDTVILTVSGKDDGQVTMRVTGMLSAAKESDIEIRLSSIGVPPERTNVLIASALSSMGIALDAETIARAVEIAKQYPMLGIRLAAFAAANLIEVTPENLESLLMLGDASSKVALQLAEITGVLELIAGGEYPEEIVLEASYSGVDPEALSVGEGSGLAQPEGGDVLSEGVSGGTDSGENMPVLAAESGQEGIPGDVIAASAEEPGGISALENARRAAASDTIGSPSLGEPVAVESPLTAGIYTDMSADSEAAREYRGEAGGTAVRDAAIMLIAEEVLRVDGKSAVSGLDPDEFVRIGSEFLSRLAGDMPDPAGMVESSAEAVDHMRKSLSGAEGQAAGTIGGSPGAGERIRDLGFARRLMGELFADIRADADSPERLRSTLGTLERKLAILRVAAGIAENSAAEMAVRQIDRLVNDMKIHHDIERFMYFQIPVLIEGREETAELYVFKNNKNATKKIDPENVTILLAVDTENIGRVESLIEIREKRVSVKFRLDGEDQVMFLENSTVELFRILGEIGYKLADARFQTSEERADPLSALTILARGRSESSRRVDIEV